MPSTSLSAKLQLIEKFAVNKLNEHGLSPKGWVFKWDRAKRRFGCCDYTNKQISVSQQLAALNSIEQCHDTVLHEIAHALAGKKAGHGPLWIETCIRIGAKPERCYSSGNVQTPTAKYVRYCTNCLHARPLFRRSNKKYACGHCCKNYNHGRYTDKYLLKTVEYQTYQAVLAQARS